MDPSSPLSPPLRSGTVTLIGRPNTGKSTLVNAAVGMQVAIATHKPQTTRNRILGICHREGRGQIVFIDTPGVHRSERALNRRMVDAAWDAAEQTDAVLWMLDASALVRHAGQGAIWGDNEDIRARLENAGPPVLIALNKVDLVPQRQELLPVLEALNALTFVRDVVPISAVRGDQVELLLDLLLGCLPEQAPLFPEDMVTDRAERFLAAEMIREQVLLQTHQEVPYGTAIRIEEFIDDPVRDRLLISATVLVERDSQKGIVIGRQGSRLRAVGTAARHALIRFFGRPVHLELQVRLQQDWTSRERTLRELGYDKDDI